MSSGQFNKDFPNLNKKNKISQTSFATATVELILQKPFFSSFIERKNMERSNCKNY